MWWDLLHRFLALCCFSSAKITFSCNFLRLSCEPVLKANCDYHFKWSTFRHWQLNSLCWISSKSFISCSIFPTNWGIHLCQGQWDRTKLNKGCFTLNFLNESNVRKNRKSNDKILKVYFLSFGVLEPVKQLI